MLGLGSCVVKLGARVAGELCSGGLGVLGVRVGEVRFRVARG